MSFLSMLWALFSSYQATLAVLSLILAAILAYASFIQMKGANIPLLDARLETAGVGLIIPYLDLFLENHGPGAAKNIRWIILPADEEPQHYIRRNSPYPAYIHSPESRKFAKDLKALGSKAEKRVKGRLLLDPNFPNEVGYRLFIRYQSSISWFRKQYSEFEFSYVGEQLNSTNISRKEFKEQEGAAIIWMKKLEGIAEGKP